MSLVKSVFKVFDGKQKRKLFGMAFLILINSGVSLLGVSVLLPFIQAVTAPEELLANRYVAAFYEWMGMENPNELITAIAIGIVIVYLAKNAFIIFMNNMQYRFSYYGKREMQDRLMKYYISKDYTFFLNHNSAELMRDINNDPEMFYAAVLNMLQLAAELCTSTILIIFLVVTDPIITLGVALAMMLMVLLFMKKLKRTLARFGDERRKYNANIIQCMQQAFGGIKEIKIANRESYFEEEFRKQNGLYTYVIKQNAFLSSIPKPVMEALCIAGLMITIAVRINMTESDPTHFVGVLAVFAAAAFYLLPSANKMSEYLASIIHNGVVIHKIGEEYTKIRDLEIDLSEERDYPAMALEREIRVNDMTFTYPEMEEPVLSHVNVTIPKNSSVAFIGPSGAGKTTMVNLLMRFFEVNSGHITIDGVATTDLRREDVHELFGMVLQDTWLFEGTIRENLVYNMEGITDEQLETVCKACGLDKFVHSLPQGFDTVLSESTTISAGQKQLLTIARAMLQNAPMLILDEATSSVDTRTELLIQRAMDELTKGRTSFVIAHRLSTIKNADLILVMRDGDVIESGTHEQLMEQNGFYAELYNSQFAQAS